MKISWLNKLFNLSFLPLFSLFFLPHSLFSQPKIDCDTIYPSLHSLELRLSKINVEDPELISLHYFFILDIEKELQHFAKEIIPSLHFCLDLNYYQVVDLYDDINFKMADFKKILSVQKEKVDSLFYEKAKVELIYDNRSEAHYYLDRALQYNRLQPDALLLKTILLFEDNQYDKSIELIHVLYNEAELNRSQEMAVSDFTSILYDHLYKLGDSLIKVDHAADALEIFNLLEKFCFDMPSNYCNDDYYHGIMRSKAGVYDSYLAISKAAEERGNFEMSRKFLDYAEQYKTVNHDEMEFSDAQKSNPSSKEEVSAPKPEVVVVEDVPAPKPVEVVVVEEVPAPKPEVVVVEEVPTPKPEEVLVVEEVPTPKPEVVVVEEVPTPKPEEVLVVEEVPTPKPEEVLVVEEVPAPKPEEVVVVEEVPAIVTSTDSLSHEEKEIAYNRLLLDALTNCVVGEFEEAYSELLKAKELEQCNCFPKDPRVVILLTELQKYY